VAGDWPDVPFVKAKKFGNGRPDGPPLWIVWHTMEHDEVGDAAEDVAHYFATLPDDRSVSAHYTVDNNSIIQCVLLGNRAWTVGNTPGNNRGINYELAGRASQTAAQWADAYSDEMLTRACAQATRDMELYGIPNRWCSIDDLTQRRPGHTTHNDLRVAFGGTTHTDPGSGFPRQRVLDLVAGGDMAAADNTWQLVAGGEVEGFSDTVSGGIPRWWLRRVLGDVPGPEVTGDVDRRSLRDLSLQILDQPPVDAAALADELAEKLATNPAFINGLAEALAPLLAPLLNQSQTLTIDLSGSMTGTATPPPQE